MAMGFDLDKSELASMFFKTAEREVQRLCRLDKTIDEHAAMDVAIDKILKILPRVQGVRLVENYAQTVIRNSLRKGLKGGGLKYVTGGESLDASDRDYADVDANSDVEQLEMDEFLAAITSEDERELIATGGEGLNNAEKCKLVRIRKRLKDEFAAE